MNRAEDDHAFRTYLSSAHPRDPFSESESLGTHCEGPFYAHKRMGVNLPDAIHASGEISELERVFNTYGVGNLLDLDNTSKQACPRSTPSHVRMITIAPERPGALNTIRQLSQVGIIMSIGHTDSSRLPTG